MKGQLFAQYFLTDGIRTTPEWEAGGNEVADVRRDLVTVYERFGSLHQPNEAVTEQELIRPVLEQLGWTDYLAQQGAAGREDVPDHLLFADGASKVRAAERSNSDDRFQDALVVQESKRYGLVLDQRPDGPRGGTPHGQMLRYLTTADVASEGRIRFGIWIDSVDCLPLPPSPGPRQLRMCLKPFLLSVARTKPLSAATAPAT